MSRKEDFYEKIDILLHPAQREAYGMVIAEALSVGIPIVCSSECGVSFHAPQDSLGILPFDSPSDLWARLLLEMLGKSQNNQLPLFCRPWQNVALDYLKVYQSVKS